MNPYRHRTEHYRYPQNRFRPIPRPQPQTVSQKVRQINQANQMKPDSGSSLPPKQQISQPQNLTTITSSYQSTLAQDQILEIRWTPGGQKIVVAERCEMKILGDIGLGGSFKVLSRVGLDYEVMAMRFVNQNVFGAFGDHLLKFWDLRSKLRQEVMSIKFPQQQVTQFEINEKSQWFTLGHYTQIRNYDFRKTTNNNPQYISRLECDFPIYEIKWYELQPEVLITSGGNNTKGIFSIFDKQMNNILYREVDFSPIVSFAFSDCVPKKIQEGFQIGKLAVLSESNCLQILQFPQFMTQTVISIPQQQESLGCLMSYNEQYIVVTQQDQILIYDIDLAGKQSNKDFSNNTDMFGHQKPIQILKSGFSLASWHPYRNMLVYVDGKQKSKVSFWKP